MKLLLVLISGILFGLGLSFSNMINPTVVLNFLDVFGQWDPSLMFVMAGALITVGLGFKWIFKRKAPLFSDEFHLPKLKNIDQNLVSGAVIFGVGWGLAGYCPGPALASLAYGYMEPIIFCIAMFAGFKCSQLVKK